MKAYFLSFLVIFSQLSWSSTNSSRVVALGSSAPMSSYLALIRSNPRLTSMASWQQQRVDQDPQGDKLFEKFELAQKFYFNADKSVALDAFKEVLKYLNLKDWNSSQRKLLFVAALRCAELSESESDQINYLQQAVQASLKFTPDAQVFSPPFIKKFNQIKKTLIESHQLISDQLTGFETLSFSGVQHSLLRPNQKVSLPKGKVLVTVYSSRWESVSAVLNAKEISRWNPAKKDIVNGACGSTKISNRELAQPVSYVFHGKNCLLARNGAPDLMSNKKPQSVFAKHNAPPHSVDFSKVSMTPKEQNAWWKNKWLWMGLAGAGAAYIIYENSRSQGGTRQGGPTTTYE